MNSSFPKLLLLFFLSFQTVAQTTVMSYNIRYDNKNDQENWWGNRKEETVKLINYYHPDFLGVQEAVYNQVIYIQENTDYAYIGVGRDDGKKKGEFSAIYYDARKFDLVKENTFWLSETPDKISVGWDASMERICTYGLFKNKSTGEEIYVFNTHFDHIGPEAREQSAVLILAKIKEYASENAKVVLMGDLNAEPLSKPIEKLKSELDEGFEISKEPPYGPISTFNGFEADLVPDRRIDYIFAKNMEVLEYRHIADRRLNNLWPSDHLPVLVKIK